MSRFCYNSTTSWGTGDWWQPSLSLWSDTLGSWGSRSHVWPTYLATSSSYRARFEWRRKLYGLLQVGNGSSYSFRLTCCDNGWTSPLLPTSGSRQQRSRSQSGGYLRTLSIPLRQRGTRGLYFRTWLSPDCGRVSRSTAASARLSSRQGHGCCSKQPISLSQRRYTCNCRSPNHYSYYPRDTHITVYNG